MEGGWSVSIPDSKQGLSQPRPNPFLGTGWAERRACSPPDGQGSGLARVNLGSSAPMAFPLSFPRDTHSSHQGPEPLKLTPAPDHRWEEVTSKESVEQGTSMPVG